MFTKQIPTGGEDFGRQVGQATAPAARVIQYRPDSIVIHTTGKYSFLYETTSSVGGTVPVGTQNYITGANIDAEGGGNVLPIQPVAWHRIAQADAGDEGDVTFIYRGRPE